MAITPARMARRPQERGPRFIPPRFAASPTAAVRYDLSDSTSYITATGIKVLGDKSGNSGVNVLCLNGNTACYASFPAVTAFGSADFTVVVKFTINSLAANNALFGGIDSSFGLFTDTSGKIVTGKVAVANNTVSTTAISAFTTYTITYVKASGNGTYYLNAVSAGTTVDANNYTVGCDRSGIIATAAAFPCTGNIYQIRVYNSALNPTAVTNDYNGTVQAGCVLNIDFSTAAKLASSFTATTGGTVTINTTGDLGARIIGARDACQMTAAKQFAVSGTTATADGVNDYMESPNFPLAQPLSVLYVGQNKVWASGEYIFDGDAANSMGLMQTTGTPKVSINAGSVAAENSDFAVGADGVVQAVFNAASSSLQVNNNTPTTGNPGTATPNGITLAALNSVVNFANCTYREFMVHPIALDAAARRRMASYAGLKWGIAV